MPNLRSINLSIARVWEGVDLPPIDALIVAKSTNTAKISLEGA
jgi:hypothetical protein